MSRIDFVTGAPEQYAHLVDALATVPDRVRAAVNGHSDDDLRRPTEDGGWSAQRVLAHLAIYAHSTGVFIHRMVTMTDPERVFEDEDAIVEARGLMNSAAEDLLRELEAEVGETVGFLSETPDAAWGRRGMAMGMSRSVRQQVQRHIDHFEEHIAQLHEILGTREQAA